ncbi:MAG TPA: maleylpyruvate isomerase N-terminal domain-containing protein [Candidatus Limnocylindrales bacterium]
MNVIDVLTFGQRDVERLLARFRPNDWEVVALGTWTAKDLVGHLGAFEARFADVLATFAGEPVATDLMRTDPATFNDDQAAIRKDWPREAILSELRDAFERGITLARQLPPETWTRVGSIPWYGPGYALDDLAVYSMYGHKREHAPQLEAVLERPGRD